MPFSPLCLVADGAGPYAPTAGGVNVGAHNTISVKLADTTGTANWYLSVLGTDELSATPFLANVNPGTGQVISPTSIVTFTFPNGLGRTVVFQSTVVNGASVSLTTTFAVYSLTAVGSRCGGVNETREGNAAAGWAAILNPINRRGASYLYYDDAVVPSTGANTIQGAIDFFKPRIFTAGGDLSGTWTNQTVVGLHGVALSGVAPISGQVLGYNGTQWAGVAPPVTFTAGGDLSGSSSSQTVVGLHGVALSGVVPTPGQVLGYNGTQWAGVAPPITFTAGGDLSGTSTNQAVSFIQGVSTPVGSTAQANYLMTVGSFIPWADPNGIVAVGSALWVSDASTSNIYKVLPPSGVATYPAPSIASKLVTDGTNIFAAGVGTSPLFIVASSNGAVIGQALATGFTTDLALLGGEVWTVEGVNGLRGYNIAALLAAYPVAVAPASTLPMPGAAYIVSDGTYLYVSDGSTQVHKVDPAGPTVIGTYTDGFGRALNALFYDPTVAGGADLFAMATSSMVRISRTAMTFVATIPVSGPHVGGLSAGLAYDGTYLYVGASPGNRYVDLVDPATNTWFAEYVSSGFAGGQAHYMAFLGGSVWATVFWFAGTPGLQEFTSLGPQQSITGALGLQYTPPPTALPPNGAAGGDLTGSYPSPTVAKLQGQTVSSATPVTSQVLEYDGAQWSPTTAFAELNPVDLSPHETSNQAVVNFMPTALVAVNDQMTGSLGRFTTLSEGTPKTPTQSGGQLTIANTTGQNTGLQEGSDMGMCQFATSLHIVSLNGATGTYANVGVGWAKDSNNFILAAWRKIDGLASIQVKIGGVSNFQASVSVSWTPPFDIGLSLVASSLVFWMRPNGGSWTKISTYDVSGTFNFKTQSLTGWKGALWFASQTNGTLVVDQFQIGRFGSVGFRDPAVVTNLDGTPSISSDVVTLTATCTDPTAAAYCGVFTLNLVSRVLTQVGVITVNRSAQSQNDSAAHIVLDGTGGYHLFISTWGNSGAANIQVLYKHEVSLNLLAGANAVGSMTQLSLAGIPVSGGAYDPYMVKVGSTYYVAYTAGPATPSTFYPVLNSSPDLSSFSLVGQDINAFPYEGTRIVKLGGSYWVSAASLVDANIYDLAMSYQGKYSNLVLGSGNPAHVTLVPDGSYTYQITFDNTLYLSVANTLGHLRVFRSRRYGVV